MYKYRDKVQISNDFIPVTRIKRIIHRLFGNNLTGQENPFTKETCKLEINGLK